MKMPRVFVTGGSGFLGRTLVPLLKKQGFVVDAPASCECDLMQERSLESFKAPYDYIFHLAAWTQAGDFCLKHPGEQWLINQKINTHVLAWWKQRQPQAKAVLIGTSCAYDPTLPLTEDNYLRGEPIESLYTYAMTKRMLWIGAQSLGKQYGLKAMNLVPSTLCGNYYHEDGRQMHFIYDVVRKIINHKKSASRILLWGDGEQRREILLVQEFVAGALRLLDIESAWGQTINLGAGRDYSIREFAEEACKICGVNPSALEFDPYAYVGAKAKCLDTKKICSLISWNPIKITGSISEVVTALNK